MRPKGQITPRRLKGREFYVATFFHPIRGERVTRGLGTKLEAAARRVCDGLEKLCANPDLPPAQLKLIDPRAREIFLKDASAVNPEVERILGTQHIQQMVILGREVCPEFTPQEIEDVLRELLLTGENSRSNQHDISDITENPVFGFMPVVAPLMKLLKEQGVSQATFEALSMVIRYGVDEINRQKQRADSAVQKYGFALAEEGLRDLVVKVPSQRGK